MSFTPGETIARLGTVGVGVGLMAAGMTPAHAAPSPIDLRAAGSHTYNAGGPVTGSAGRAAAAADAYAWSCTIFPNNPRLLGDEVEAGASQTCSGEIYSQTLRAYVKQWNNATEAWQRVGSSVPGYGAAGTALSEGYHYCTNYASTYKFRTEAVGTGSGNGGTATATDYSDVVNLRCY